MAIKFADDDKPKPKTPVTPVYKSSDVDTLIRTRRGRPRLSPEAADSSKAARREYKRIWIIGRRIAEAADAQRLAAAD